MKMRRYRFKSRFKRCVSGALDAVGDLVFWSMKRRLQPSTLKKVLFIRLDHLGDIVSSTPVYREFKANFPDARLSVLTSPLGKVLLSTNPYIDEILAFNNSINSQYRSLGHLFEAYPAPG